MWNKKLFFMMGLLVCLCLSVSAVSAADNSTHIIDDVDSVSHSADIVVDDVVDSKNSELNDDGLFDSVQFKNKINCFNDSNDSNGSSKDVQNPKGAHFDVEVSNISYGDDIVVNIHNATGVNNELLNATAYVTINNRTYYFNLVDGEGNYTIHPMKYVYVEPICICNYTDGSSKSLMSANTVSGDYYIDFNNYYNQDVGVGNHLVNVTIVCENYTIVNTTSFNVSKGKPQFNNIYVSNLYFGKNLEYSVTIYGAFREKLLDNYKSSDNGSEYLKSYLYDEFGNLVNGSVLGCGNYSLVVEFLGDENHYAANSSVSFKVLPTPSVDIAVDNITYGDDIFNHLFVNVTGVNGELINYTDEVSFYIYNQSGDLCYEIYHRTWFYEMYDVKSKKYYSNLHFSLVGSSFHFEHLLIHPGIYTVVAKYEGNENYTGAYSVNKTFIVSKGNVNIEVSNLEGSDLIILICDGDDLVINLTNAIHKDISLSGKNITVFIDGKEYHLVTDENGSCRLPIKVSKKNYSCVVSFNGDDDYCAFNKTFKLEANVLECSDYKKIVGVKKVYVTVNDIIKASVTLKKYASKNKKLPRSIKVGSVKCTNAQFSYLMSVAIKNINAKKKISTKIKVISVKASNKKFTVNTKITKGKYLSIVKSLASKGVKGKLPSYVRANGKKIGFSNYDYALAKILSFYKSNKRLPKFVICTGKF